MDGSGKNNWVGVLIIAVVVLGAFFFVSRSRTPNLSDVPAPASSLGIVELPLFTQGISAAGINNVQEIGFHSFSPDGKYFFFSTFTPAGNPPNQARLMRLSDGNISTLPGFAERGFDDARVIQLYQSKGITLYWPATGEQKSYNIGENIFWGSLSPDGKIYIVNTAEGIKKIDIASGIATSFTKNQYDGAYAWFSDSNRMLGFRETDEALTDGAGKAREIGIWNMTTADFVPIATSITAKTFRSVSWVVPNRVARINAGFDDGSHDYLLNVDTKQVVDIGDTSGSLMGGVKTDPVHGLFALVGGDDAASIGSRALLYRGMEKRHDMTLPKGYFREQMHIVDDHRLIYLRKQWGATEVTKQELVLLDLRTGEESVLHDLEPRSYAAVSLSADKKTWVLSQRTQFITGTI